MKTWGKSAKITVIIQCATLGAKCSRKLSNKRSYKQTYNTGSSVGNIIEWNITKLVGHSLEYEQYRQSLYPIWNPRTISNAEPHCSINVMWTTVSNACSLASILSSFEFLDQL